MAITGVLPALAVSNFTVALDRYERFFGRPVDDQPMDGLAEWHLTSTDRIQIVRDEERAGAGLITIAVDDLQAHLGELAARGIDPGPIDQQSEKVLFVTVHDPDGNAVTLVQARGNGA